MGRTSGAEDDLVLEDVSFEDGWRGGHDGDDDGRWDAVEACEQGRRGERVSSASRQPDGSRARSVPSSGRRCRFRFLG